MGPSWTESGVFMRRILMVSAAAAALALADSSGFAMGGGGGGGYGMGMGDMAQPSEYSQALRLIKHQEFSDAIPHLDAALQQNPNDADVLNYEGYAHRMVGDYTASLDYYNKALAIDPDHKGVHEYLGELYLQTHQPDKAQAELTLLTKMCPSGCDEKDTLTASITKYQAANPVPAPAAAAPDATTPAPAAASTPAQ
jgi:tetratricopeptide (TPR) repeat protein